MVDAITLVYILNSTLLFVHEIDSAYWKEWELFRLPGEIAGFLVIHVPLVALILYGVLEASLRTALGYYINLIVALGGLFAFSIHSYFIKTGNPQFKTTASQTLLYSILVSSIAQLYLALTSW
jgi:hypothetical protein